MAANRKSSRGTIRRSRRGPKAVGKSAPVAAPKKTTQGKSPPPALEKAVGPVQSKSPALPTQNAPESEAAKAAVSKAAVSKSAAANASVAPVKVAAAVNPLGPSAGKPPKPEPRAGGEAATTAVAPALLKAPIAKPEVALPAALSDQQPGAVAAALGAVLSLANENDHPRETRLRDDKRYTDLAGPDMVPLSRKVSNVVWAFDVVDTFTGTRAVGSTRIFAVLDKKPDIELATISTRSGRLVVQTTIALKKNETGAGVTLDKKKVVGLRFENDLYESTTIAEKDFLEPLKLIPAPSYPFPSAHDPNGSMAFILGHAPADFDTGGVARMIDPELSGAGSQSLIDRERRFALWGPADAVLANKITDDKSGFKVVLEIGDAPGSNRNLTLTYRATRDTPDKSPPAKAPDTARMKLTEQSLAPAAPPIQAVPLVHLLLQ